VAVTNGRPVVALRALGLGDLLTGVPALRALADAFPGHPVLLACPAALAPLARISGAVDEVVPTAGLADGPLRPRLHHATVAVNLHGRGPESHQLLLATAPERLVGFAHPAVPASAGAPRWRSDEHEVTRWCRLLTESGIPAEEGRLDLDPPPGPAPAGAAGATLVHPGAGSPARRWPPERFAAVARAEHDKGRPVLISAGPREARLARAIAAGAGPPPRAPPRLRSAGGAGPCGRRRAGTGPPGRRGGTGGLRRHRSGAPGDRAGHPLGGAVRASLPRQLGTTTGATMAPGVVGRPVRFPARPGARPRPGGPQRRPGP
jgi:hypothetical protein